MTPLPALSWVLAVLLLAAAPSADAQPFAGNDLVWMRPAVPAGAAQPCDRLLVLSAPRDWATGDAAVVLVTAAPHAEAAAAHLAEALLAEETAVARLRAGDGGGIGPCASAPADPVAELLGALAALRGQAGAGLVVAIGLGAAGPAALAAAEEEVAQHALGAGDTRLAAGIALDEAGTRFRAGPPPPPREAWAARVPLLCEALAPLTGAEAAAACQAALAPAARGLASLRGPRP